MPNTEELQNPDKLPCPVLHLSVAVIALAPTVITVPANLNIVLTAAVTVWVGSRRSVKDTPPEESMTRSVMDVIWLNGADRSVFEQYKEEGKAVHTAMNSCALTGLPRRMP